jgi:hypothetical protein
LERDSGGRPTCRYGRRLGGEQFEQCAGFLQKLLEGLQPAGCLSFFELCFVAGLDQAGELRHGDGEVGRLRGGTIESLGEMSQSVGARPGRHIVRVLGSAVAGVVEPAEGPERDAWTCLSEPEVRLVTLVRGELGVDPRVGLGQRPCVIMDLQDEGVQVVEAVAGVSDEEGADVGSLGGGASEVVTQQIPEHRIALDAVLDFILNGELRVEIEIVKMFADQPEAEGVQGGDEGGVEQGALFRNPGVLGVGLKSGIQSETEAVTHLGGGRLVEGDHQHPVDGNGRRGVESAIEDAGDEGAGLAGTGAGHDEHVAGGLDSDALLRGGGVQGGAVKRRCDVRKSGERTPEKKKRSRRERAARRQRQEI